MKTDKTYSHIKVCPDTGTMMSEHEISYSGGVCPHCGDATDYSFTHSKKVVGRFIRPSLYERIFEGKRLEFLRKDEEDKIMERLSQ